MSSNREYKAIRIRVREDHLTALEAKVDAMGGTVTQDFFVNDALAQYLGPRSSGNGEAVEIDPVPRFEQEADGVR